MVLSMAMSILLSLHKMKTSLLKLLNIPSDGNTYTALLFTDLYRIHPKINNTCAMKFIWGWQYCWLAQWLRWCIGTYVTHARWHLQVQQLGAGRQQRKTEIGRCKYSFLSLDQVNFLNKTEGLLCDWALSLSLYIYTIFTCGYSTTSLYKSLPVPISGKHQLRKS